MCVEADEIKLAGNILREDFERWCKETAYDALQSTWVTYQEGYRCGYITGGRHVIMDQLYAEEEKSGEISQ